MAYSAANLYTMNAGATQVHVYKSADAIATVAASGYFNDATNNLKQGDIIIASDTNAGTVDLLAVTSATGAATVTTVNGT